jgi:hypothetical protein
MDEETPLQGNTGMNDQNSIWNSGWLADAGNLVKSGFDIYKQTQGSIVPDRPAASPTLAAGGSSWTRYLPWVGGGLVLLLVLGFVFRRR